MKKDEQCFSDRLRTAVRFISADGLLLDKVPEQQQKLCLDSVKCFKATGYMLGDATLFKGIRQLEAASELKSNNRQVRYWEFLPKNHIDDSLRSNKQTLDSLITSLRCLPNAQGRQIVVPLSGGYDSRAILLGLVHLGYTNIVTFTFGRTSSPEVQLSKHIANTLGVEWHCVTYTKQMWRRLKGDSNFNRYLDFCSKGVSVPNIQVYPALESLISKGVIKSNAIVLPGHTGDFVSGGHIPAELMIPFESIDQIDDLAKVIIKRHFKFDRALREKGQVPSYLSNQLHSRFDKYVNKGYPLASLFEAWECSERQAKFIVNSNRYYEFFNLDWFMPLWQDNFVDFWINVPYSQRQNKQLWVDSVELLWQMVTGADGVLGHAETHLRPWQLKWKHRLDYFFDNNHLLQLVPFKRWLMYKLRLSNRSGQLYGYLADVMVERYKAQAADKPIWPS